MATLRILVPDGITNYVKNPSARYDTSGWTVVGSTLSRVLTYARFGIASLSIVTNGSALNEGAYYRVNNLTNVNDPITVSAYVRGTGRARIRVISSGGSQAYSEDVILSLNRWTRISATGRHNGSNDIRVYVETNGNAAQSVTFYVDGVQMERKAYPTTYCLAPSTIVVTQRGHLSLGDVAIGDELLDEKGGYNKIVKKWCVKTTAYKITLETGQSIIASGDHRFSFVPYKSGFSSKWRWRWGMVGELTPGDYIQLHNQPTFENRGASDSFAYIMGYLLGDGYFTTNTSRNQPLIAWTFGKEEMQMAQTVEKLYRESLPKKGYHEYPKAKFSSDNEITLRTQDRDVAEVFKRAGFPSDCSASEKTMPESVYNYDQMQFLDFLAGLIDSDGCVDKRGNLHIDSSSSELIEQAHFLIATRLGVHGWLGQYTDQSNFSGRERTSYRVSFKKADAAFLSLIGLTLRHPRKAQRIRLASGEKRRHAAKIETIECLGERELIDITLSPAHSFIANGMVTHNCDGDQAGCRWNGVAHNSISIRDPYTRAGGRWITVAGPAREEENLYMTVVGGLGVAPLVNNVQSYGDSPGSYFQNAKVLERQVTLTFHAKHVNLFGETPVSLRALHQLRQLLIDIIKPDRTAGGEEFTLEYQDGAFPIYFKARYDGGLEGEWDIRNQWVNSFPLRLLAISPFLWEDTQDVASLTFQSSTNRMNQIIQRVDGEWMMMNYGVSNSVGDLEVGRRGEVVAGGSFSSINNNAAAIDPVVPSRGIAYWDGDQWQKLGSSGVAGGAALVNDVTVAPNGDIYIGGDFTSVGGVAANNIAKWNGSAWSALGTGTNNDVNVMRVAPNGNVYVGGQFTTAGGVTARYIARWDGSSWHSVGVSAGLDNFVYSIAISQDGLSVYVAGVFQDEFGASGDNINHVALYDPTANQFSALGEGLDANVLQVVLSPAGVLYACGDFTLSGSQTINHIATWNGANWLPLGAGINGTVHSMDVAPNNDLLAVGSFTEAGGVEATNAALWNGSVWTNLDITLTALSLVAVYNLENGNLYLAANQNSAVFSGVTYMTNNGSAEVAPVIYARGPGMLQRIENYTTKKRIFLELDILNGEEIFIDFGRARITSTVRGDLSYAVLSGSDFKAFTLVPGQNKIISFMTEDVAALMQISYVPRHWSADATQALESL